MKGIVFTEFLDLVEDKFGLEMVDKIISQSTLESEGIYTSIGTYSFSEMLQLLQHLSRNTSISIDDLLLVYAEHFFNVIEKSYPGLLATYRDPIEMLASIENHIHIEVKKIYPEAELPTFIIEERTENSLIMIYKSSRAMHHFGLGLMNKTFDHFNSKASIILEKIREDGTEVKFIIKKIE
ncbi:heme NO-binding domain-containing protein [Tenacibaculum sp. HL-MS23]|uniref:heme NO-binding domain-containing protein n=1 Tax=unclassified Tenacibaculum TaxID=2635139 RepID=UPI001C4F11D4|nr:MULTISPECIES: heme NO-binding domain-containing protein [unclassified Tenacibaculum]QXP73674.1 heme NO-binding domain-containing protein [Tenacibaculum sp. AHE14PA]QXP75959.1 heme NO-binding domain-containing protein [Tenacibaculum sp. AHE15PA]WNW02522.1 heme NO-binding domain-containing protein [Tenacibaculum sp. HL-MS23]